MTKPKRDDDHLYVIGQKNDRGQTICGSRKSGYPKDPHPCRKTNVTENGRCPTHAGPRKTGVAHPNYIHGKDSKYANLGRLAPDYERRRNRRDVLEQLDEIAMLGALEEEALTQYLSGTLDVEHARKLVKEFESLSRRQTPENEQRIMAILEELFDMIKSSPSSRDREAYLRIVAQKTKLIESERKRIVEHAEVIRYGVAVRALDDVISAVMDEVEIVVTDPRDAKRILDAGQRAYNKFMQK